MTRTERLLRRLPREDRRLARAALDAGWLAKPKKNGVMLLSPDGKQSVTMHLTNSDPRAILNTRALLRRYGVDV